MIAGSRSMVMSRSSDPVSWASTMEPGRTCDAMSSTMPSGRARHEVLACLGRPQDGRQARLGGGEDGRPAEWPYGGRKRVGSDPVGLLHELGRALDLVPAARPVVAARGRGGRRCGWPARGVRRCRGAGHRGRGRCVRGRRRWPARPPAVEGLEHARGPVGVRPVVEGQRDPTLGPPARPDDRCACRGRRRAVRADGADGTAVEGQRGGLVEVLLEAHRAHRPGRSDGRPGRAVRACRRVTSMAADATGRAPRSSRRAGTARATLAPSRR